MTTSEFEEGLEKAQEGAQERAQESLQNEGSSSEDLSNQSYDIITGPGIGLDKSDETISNIDSGKISLSRKTSIGNYHKNRKKLTSVDI